MKTIKLSLLRGVCQIPAYAACKKNFFAREGLDASFTITPTAWLVPQQLASGGCDFAVLPWTRVAVAEQNEAPLRVVCGSGFEEAALVVRKNIPDHAVGSVAVPREGGMKDLTALSLVGEMQWEKAAQRRYPSGDGAIIAFVGESVDAASMVEPYATMFEMQGHGRVAKRTGDVWPGAPGCSLACAAALIDRDPDLVARVVHGYLNAIDFVVKNPDEAAQMAAPIIGVNEKFIAAAIEKNPPVATGIRNTEIMRQILGFMQKLGYTGHIPHDFVDLRFLNDARP